MRLEQVTQVSSQPAHVEMPVLPRKIRRPQCLIVRLTVLTNRSGTILAPGRSRRVPHPCGFIAWVGVSISIQSSIKSESNRKGTASAVPQTYQPMM